VAGRPATAPEVGGLRVDAPTSGPGAVHRVGAHVRAINWRQRRPWLIVAGLMAAGLAVRLLMFRGIWLDEAIGVDQAQMSLPAMIDDLRETDRHPPLYQLILWFTVRVLGAGEMAVRLPSIVFSLALVPALFVTGRILFDRRTGLAAAALGTIAPLVIWYGQEARMYALLMLLATLAVWAQVRVLRDGRPRNWVLYAGITIALLYTQYLALIPIMIQQGVFGIAAWKRAQRGLPVRGLLTGCWLTWLALVLAAAPLAPYAHEQIDHIQRAAGTGVTSAGGAQVPQVSPSVYGVITNFVWAIWGYHTDDAMFRIAALWPLLMLLSLAVLGRVRSAQIRVLFALAFGPVLVLFLAGFVKRELFEVRYFASVVPMLLLLLARAATGMRHRAPALALMGALLVSFGVALADQQLSPTNPRQYDFRGALEGIRTEARPGDLILYAPGSLRPVVDYYAPGVEAKPIPVLEKRARAQKGRVFVLASFLDNPHVVEQVRETRRLLAQTDRRQLSARERTRIRVWKFG
jgi:Dolichyl-phosphate-mannose-protein mannosyltransferase